MWSSPLNLSLNCRFPSMEFKLFAISTNVTLPRLRLSLRFKHSLKVVPPLLSHTQHHLALWPLSLTSRSSMLARPATIFDSRIQLQADKLYALCRPCQANQYSRRVPQFLGSISLRSDTWPSSLPWLPWIFHWPLPASPPILDRWWEETR